MILPVLSAAWCGYRAYKAGRSVAGWALMGFLCFILCKVLAVLILSNMQISTNSQASFYTIAANICIIGAVVFLGLLIDSSEPHQEPPNKIANPKSDIKIEKTSLSNQTKAEYIGRHV